MCVREREGSSLLWLLSFWCSLSEEQRQNICNDALKIAKAVNYRSAGTVEFLVDHEGNHHLVYAFGNIETTSAVKFHHIIPDNVLLANETKFKSLLNAIDYLKANNGVLIFIDSEYSSNQELREFGVGAQILKKLGIETINLLSSTQGKEYIGLAGFGLNIDKEIVL